jgi:hypothetical protein
MEIILSIERINIFLLGRSMLSLNSNIFFRRALYIKEVENAFNFIKLKILYASFGINISFNLGWSVINVSKIRRISYASAITFGFSVYADF